MISSMSKAEKTKQLIIEKTADVFNSKGYAATSLSDITKVTGLTKGSIYGNFDDKEEVVIAAFKFNAKRLRDSMEAAISKEETAYEQLMAMLNFYKTTWKKAASQGGCPMLNAATEADDHLLFLSDAVKENFIAWQNKIANIIEKGKAEGSFKTNLQSEIYAYTFIMLIEGGILLSRTLNQITHLNTALDRVKLIIDQEFIH
jgi:AcrR family transcriptional regulator